MQGSSIPRYSRDKNWASWGGRNFQWSEISNAQLIFILPSPSDSKIQQLPFTKLSKFWVTLKQDRIATTFLLSQYLVFTKVQNLNPEHQNNFDLFFMALESWFLLYRQRKNGSKRKLAALEIFENNLKIYLKSWI